jgi:formamidopyrimidine-DNA glycosylase
MPELPEVEALAAWVRSHLSGKTVREIRLRSVAALKTYDPPLNALIGQTVTGAVRRGKYLAVEFDELKLVTHLSLGGWIRWIAGTPDRKTTLRGPIIAEVRFDDGQLDFTEHGKEKRLALWVVHSLDNVPPITTLGPEALDPALDPPALAGLLRTRPATLKSVLADQHVIAGIGNAYSDDILHAARLSPFLKTTALTDEQAAALHTALHEILDATIARATGIAAAGLKEDKKSHFRIHARTGEPCPTCGDTIREVWSGSRSFQYCPSCQTGGKVYKDRRLSRLLK